MIVKTAVLPKVIKKIKSDPKTIAVCGGCFDILHPGHIYFLNKAIQKGDKK